MSIDLRRNLVQLIASVAFIAFTLPISKALDETETLSLLVNTVAKTDDDQVRLSLIKGMLRGLEGRRNVGAPEGWGSLRDQIREGKLEPLRQAASQLDQVFGNQEAAEASLAIAMDSKLDVSQRQSAIRSLIAIQSDLLVDQLPVLLKVPELRLDAIRASAAIGDAAVAEAMLKHYHQFSSNERRAVIETMATRVSFARDLVDAIEQGTVKRAEIPSHTARSLRDLLGDSFTEVYGVIPELKTNTAELIRKYKRQITPKKLQSADAGRGRAVFQKTCGACHLMYGDGGKIGPDLTGSNRANLDYLLLNSIDPSADVPEGYRTQLIQTVDGRVLTGVLAEEDPQRVVLKTVDQPRLVISKSDIELRKTSEKSMMPEGQLDQLKPQQLLDLVKYMQTKTQVEAKQ